MAFKRFFFSIWLISLIIYGKGQTPQRIVSLVPSITKQFYDLGIENRLVGCTSFCKAKNQEGVEVVASAIKVNIEKTILLKPDLVVVSSLTDKKTIESFKKVGINTAYFPAPKSFEDLCNQFIKLAEICGIKDKALQIVQSQKNRLKLIENKIPENNHPVIFIQIGANPLWTVIDNSFMGDYIKILGGINPAAGLKSGSINREFVLAKNPDVIFITTMGATAQQEKENWEKYSFLNAVKNHKIFILDADKTNAPTVIEFVDVVKEMAHLIYKIE